MEGFSYCAANFVVDEDSPGLISNRKVTDFGDMLKLETEKWSFIDEAKRY